MAKSRQSADGDTYKLAFGFVDSVLAVSDPVLRRELDNDLLAAVLGRIPSDVYLAPPEPIVYEDVGGFLYFRERHADAHDEMDLQDYRQRVDPNTLTLRDLRSHTVRLVGASTGTERDWSIYRCLVYETHLRGRTYLLSEGDWFELDPSFVERIDGGVASIPTGTLALPAAIEGEEERAYNERAAAEAGLALLDRKLVSIGGTSIEVADLVSASGDLIHVKRKTQSATLRHLFAQGRISAEALEEVDAAVREAAAAHMDTDGRVGGALLRGPYEARSKTVVYAVVASNAAELPGKLPFFSRLNLWQAHRFLTATLDYRVAFVGIAYA